MVYRPTARADRPGTPAGPRADDRAELARRLEEDIRTVRQYVETPRDLGIPVEAERGRYGAYRLRPGFKPLPLIFTEDEALAPTLSLLLAQCWPESLSARDPRRSPLAIKRIPDRQDRCAPTWPGVVGRPLLHRGVNLSAHTRDRPQYYPPIYALSGVIYNTYIGYHTYVSCDRASGGRMNYPTTFELSTTDGLTELLTSAYFRHLLRDPLLPQAQQSGDPLSLFLFDIDGFHGVNTTHGRAAGDRLLVEIARTLRQAMPEGAILSRYSGDEFAGALPDTRLDDAFTLVEEFRRRVIASRLVEWPDVGVTCSIGLAAFPANGQTDVELVRSADQALYLAKLTGRNKVSLPLADSRMVTKTSHYTATQLERLAQLAKTVGRNEAGLLREALDDVLKKYNDRLGADQGAAV